MKKCKKCGKKLTNSRSKFCSSQCCSDYRYMAYIDDWLNGINNGLKGKNAVSNHVRRFMLERANYKCEQCGWGEVNLFSGKTTLQIDHINGNFRDNKLENLKVLCPNCHSLTKTFGALNKKRNGRRVRGASVGSRN